MKLVIGILFVAMLSACSSMMENYKARVCNEEGGYEQGMNAAKSGKPMNQEFASIGRHERLSSRLQRWFGLCQSQHAQYISQC